MITTREIHAASIKMEAMGIEKLQRDLIKLRAHKKMLQSSQVVVSLPEYTKVEAAEAAAVEAIGRIMTGRVNGREMPKGTEDLSDGALPGGQEGRGPGPQGAGRR